MVDSVERFLLRGSAAPATLSLPFSLYNSARLARYRANDARSLVEVNMLPAETLVGSLLAPFLDRVLTRYEAVDVVTTRIAGRTYVTAGDLGFSLVSDDGESIDTVQMHGESSAYGPSALQLPSELLMSDSRSVARSKLGDPIRIGGGDLNPLTGEAVRDWDLFAAGKYHCHLEYLPDNSGFSSCQSGLRRTSNLMTS